MLCMPGAKISLICSFFQDGVKELFLVRDPLDRDISIYYFWGELFKLHSEPIRDQKSSFLNRNNSEIITTKLTKLPRLGSTMNTKPVEGRIQGSTFTYHGNESSPPSKSIALEYAEIDRLRLVYILPHFLV
jgi:hypothetical protein